MIDGKTPGLSVRKSDGGRRLRRLCAQYDSERFCTLACYDLRHGCNINSMPDLSFRKILVLVTSARRTRDTNPEAVTPRLLVVLETDARPLGFQCTLSGAIDFPRRSLLRSLRYTLCEENRKSRKKAKRQ